MRSFILCILASAALWGYCSAAAAQGDDPLRPEVQGSAGYGHAPCAGVRAGPDSGKGASKGIFRVAGSYNLFGLELYAILKERGGNIFFSPYSISTALSMVYAGARGHTRDEMASALHFPGENRGLHRTSSLLGRRLMAPGESACLEVEIANALWVQKGFRFRKEFIELVQSSYGAFLFPVDFSGNPHAAQTSINVWVEQKTHGRIRGFLDEGMVTADTELVVTDGVYFSGLWSVPFDRENTREGIFRISSNNGIRMPMMQQEAPLRMAVIRGVSLIELPYGDGSFSLVVLLPEERSGIAALEERLTDRELESMLERLYTSPAVDVSLTLPRFVVADKYELADVLGAMGMKTAFSPHADFSGMTGKKNLSLSAVVHKTYLEVKEEGTEATAATGAVMTKRPKGGAVFKADHPFLFVVLENATGAALFMGRLVSP